MKSVLLLATFLVGTVFGVSRFGTRTAPGYHVNNVERKYTSDAPEGFENAMNRTMVLTFEAGDYSFIIDLELNTKIYGKHTQVHALDKNGNHYIMPRRYRAFQGSGKIGSRLIIGDEQIGDVEEADCSVTFYKDLRFHGVCVSKTEVYHIDMKHLAEIQGGTSHKNYGKDTGSGMILILASEVEDIDTSSNGESVVNKHSRKLMSNFMSKKMIQSGLNKNKENFGQHQHQRSLLNDQSYLETFTGCFDGQYQNVHNLYIGHITDTSYNTVFSNDNDNILTSIEGIFNDASGANMIYYYQLNVRLVLGTTYIGAGYSGSYTYSPALISSGTDISTRLTQFNVWREEYYNSDQGPDPNGLWHLLTNNHPPAGTVGIAYVGVICSYGYGTGVTNYISYGAGTWEVWAHEVGHNFGGNHAFDEGTGSTGGIMDYGDGLYPVGYGAYQFHPTYNQDEVCAEITSSYDTTNYRWKMLPVSDCWYAESGPGPSPTPQPTTAQPTERPTGQPTDRPTNRPTERPTFDPSQRPTESPTPSPTPNPTPDPTPEPTDRPTESPTERPTNDPTDRPTNNPTDRPTTSPTNRPTNNPTSRPTNNPTEAGETPAPTITADPTTTELTTTKAMTTTQMTTQAATTRMTTTETPFTTSVVEYEWAFYDTYTDCNLECTYEGNTAYKTEIYYCYIAGTTTRVDDTNCDASTRPVGQAVACTSSEVPECDSDCGDGIVSDDEVCDTNADNGECCQSDCSGYIRDTIDCWYVNPIIDAAFMDSTYALYLFQGEYYAKYSYWWQDFTPDDGYPKTIEGSFPITSFTSDITAIGRASDSDVYVFQGNSYTIVDLDGGEYTGYPRTFTEDFVMPDELKECIEINGVTAAWVWPSRCNGHWIFAYCNNIAGYAHEEYYYDYLAAYSIRKSATFRVRHAIYYFTNSDGSARRRLQSDDDDSDTEIDLSQSIFIGTNYTSLDEIRSQSCYDENCQSCNINDKKICYECRNNYELFGSVRCLNNKTLLYLDFDIESVTSIDQFFVEGGYSTLTSGEYEYSYSGITGGNSTAMVFDGNTKLELAPLDIGEDDLYVSNFKISFRFKPYSISYDKLISIDYDNVEIILQDNSQNYLNSNINAQYLALFKVGNNTWSSNVGEGIQLNEWNTIEMQYLDDAFTVYINGETTKVAYASDFADVDVALKFNEWYIGSDAGDGIVGELDQLSLKEVETIYISDVNANAAVTIIVKNVQNDDYYTWLAIGIVFLILTVISTIGCIVSLYAYWQRRKIEKEANKDMDNVMKDFTIQQAVVPVTTN